MSWSYAGRETQETRLLKDDVIVFTRCLFQSATANSDIAKYAGEREASLEDGSEASSRRIENLRVVKIETVKFLQAIDSYLKQLEIKSDKEILLG